MSTDLQDLLRELADVDASPTPDPEALFAAGRRSTVRRRVTGATATLAAAAALGYAVWPATTLDSAPPAGTSSPTETTYPMAVGKPLLSKYSSDHYGPKLLAISTDGGPLWLVGHNGDVVRGDMAPQPRSAPAVSPNGQWVSFDAVVHGLTRRSYINFPFGDTRLGQGLWSPDSRYVVFPESVSEVDEGQLVDTQAPDAAPVILPAPTKAPFVIAGWLDGDTLLGFTSGSPSTVELRASTWTIGDTAWRETGVTLSDTTQRHMGENAIAPSLSPDGQSILVRWQEQTELDRLPLDGIPSNEERRTQARPFRLSDGAAIPLPGQKGTGLASWDGWGCRPAWQDGRPLITDHVGASPPRAPLTAVACEHCNPEVSWKSTQDTYDIETHHVHDQNPHRDR